MKIKNMSLAHLRMASITNRLRIGLGLIILFMVVLTLTGVKALTTMNHGLEHIIQVNNAKIASAQEITNAIADIDKNLLTAALVNDQEATKRVVETIKDARATYAASMSNLERLETGAKGKSSIAAIKENYVIAQNANDRAIELLAAGNLNNASNYITASAEISKLLSASAGDMVRYQQERAAENAKGARATFVRTRYLLLILGGAVLVFAVILSSLLAKSIIKPLSEGVSVAQRISRGDLTAHIGNRSQDETGQLLRALENMVENLRRIIGEVKAAAFNMASASQQLNSSSELMSKGAGEQASRATQVATASVEMSQTVLDIAKNASSIETSATGTAKLAKDGEGAVEKSVEKIRAVAKTVSESAELIKALGQRSNQIGEIINVINDIADQTNLLALNAAIEAARAGDAGRGFAVVADEVRKLAERTGNSTSEIGGMINAIQAEVRRAVLSMDNITKEVNVGVDLSNETGDVLRNIVAAVNELHLMVQQIASATEEMTSTSDEINRDIEGIASVSKETSGSSEHIAQASQELAKLSSELEKVVSGFTV